MLKDITTCLPLISTLTGPIFKYIIYLMFYVSLLQPLKDNPITYKVPLLPSIIINNSNSSYFINLINNVFYY